MATLDTPATNETPTEPLTIQCHDNVVLVTKSGGSAVLVADVPSVPQILPSPGEASEVQMTSPIGEKETSVALSQPLPPSKIISRTCKRKLMTS
jgi:hypothetical protein